MKDLVLITINDKPISKAVNMLVEIFRKAFGARENGANTTWFTDIVKTMMEIA